jgi:hypothetical protein
MSKPLSSSGLPRWFSLSTYLAIILLAAAGGSSPVGAKDAVSAKQFPTGYFYRYRVPNLYYGYPGPAPLNPNLYIVIKKARVNFPESFIRYGLVVQGDFVSYAGKFVAAILENLEGAEVGTQSGPRVGSK